MMPPFSPARNHAEEIANVRAGYAPNAAKLNTHRLLVQTLELCMDDVAELHLLERSRPYHFGASADQSKASLSGSI